MWAEFLAVAAALLSVALLVSTIQTVHADSASRMYAATMLTHHDGSAPGDGTPGNGFFGQDLTTAAAASGSDLLQTLGREGARWADHSRFETTVWASIVLIVAFLVGGYHFWETSSPRRR